MTYFSSRTLLQMAICRLHYTMLVWRYRSKRSTTNQKGPYQKGFGSKAWVKTRLRVVFFCFWVDKTCSKFPVSCAFYLDDVIHRNLLVDSLYICKYFMMRLAWLRRCSRLDEHNYLWHCSGSDYHFEHCLRLTIKPFLFRLWGVKSSYCFTSFYQGSLLTVNREPWFYITPKIPFLNILNASILHT